MADSDFGGKRKKKIKEVLFWAFFTFWVLVCLDGMVRFTLGVINMMGG